MKTIWSTMFILLITVHSLKGQFSEILFSQEYADATGSLNLNADGWFKGSALQGNSFEQLVGSKVVDLIFVGHDSPFNSEVSINFNHIVSPTDSPSDDYFSWDPPAYGGSLFGKVDDWPPKPGTYRQITWDDSTVINGVWDLSLFYYNEDIERAIWSMFFPHLNQVYTHDFGNPEKYASLSFGFVNRDLSDEYLLFRFDEWDVGSEENILDTHPVYFAMKPVGTPVPEPKIYGVIGVCVLLSLVINRHLMEKHFHR